VIRTLRSIVDPAALADAVAAAYRLPVTGCVLLRSLVNDVYRVDTRDRPRVLKLYRAGHRTRAEAGWEVELSGALGGAVARGIPLADRTPAGVLAAAEGERPYTLWEWAPGARPGPPWGDDLFRRYGAATARFHAAADAAGAPPRRFDVLDALGRPYEEVLDRVSADDRTRIAELVTAAREWLAGRTLDTGVCHGDVSLDNLHVDGDRLVFYDLDRAGTGPRAADLAGVAATGGFAAFLDGYRSVRAFGDADLAAVPWLGAVDLVGNLHFHLVDKPRLRGTESWQEGWLDRTLTALRSSAEALLR
jgi:Ser/Thr protein kinase RdoA (MazF antagonist)